MQTKISVDDNIEIVDINKTSLAKLSFHVEVARRNLEKGITLPNLDNFQTQQEIFSRMRTINTIKEYLKKPKDYQDSESLKKIIETTLRLEETLDGKHIFINEGIDYISLAPSKLNSNFIEYSKKNYKAIKCYYRTNENCNVEEHLKKLLGKKNASTTIRNWNEIQNEQSLCKIRTPKINFLTLMYDERIQDLISEPEKFFKKTKLKEPYKIKALLYCAAIINKARNKGMVFNSNSKENLEKLVSQDNANPLSNAERIIIDILIRGEIRAENIYLSINKNGNLAITNTNSAKPKPLSFCFGRK